MKKHQPPQNLCNAKKMVQNINDKVMANHNFTPCRYFWWKSYHSRTTFLLLYFSKMDTCQVLERCAHWKKIFLFVLYFNTTSYVREYRWFIFMRTWELVRFLEHTNICTWNLYPLHLSPCLVWSFILLQVGKSNAFLWVLPYWTMWPSPISLNVCW